MMRRLLFLMAVLSALAIQAKQVILTFHNETDQQRQEVTEVSLKGHRWSALRRARWSP